MLVCNAEQMREIDRTAIENRLLLPPGWDETQPAQTEGTQ